MVKPASTVSSCLAITVPINHSCCTGLQEIDLLCMVPSAVVINFNKP